jgi:hypothetical protein
MKFYLNDEKQGLVAFRNAWFKCLENLKLGKQFVVEINYKSRTIEQNEKFHAMIADIAKQAQHQGARWNAEDWKRLLLHEFAKQANLPQGRIVASLDGTGIVQLGLQSRKLTKEQGSEFIEFLFAWAAQNGVTLT